MEEHVNAAADRLTFMVCSGLHPRQYSYSKTLDSRGCHLQITALMLTPLVECLTGREPAIST